MTRSDQSPREPQLARIPDRRWLALLAFACLVAMLVSGYLGWVALTSSKIAGCGGGRLFNCGHVISSRWSLWMGIPVSLLAFGLYISLGASLYVGTSNRFAENVKAKAWRFATFFGLSAGMAAIWFISLQVFAVQHLCSYCLVAHACGLLTATILLIKRPFGVKSMIRVAGLSFVGLGLLIGGQFLTKPPATYEIETFDTPAVETEVFEFEAPIFLPPAEPELEAPLSQNREIQTRKSLANGFELMVQSVGIAACQTDFASLILAGGVLQDSGEQKSSSDSKTSPEKTAERRLVSIIGGSVQLDIAQWPLVGSKEASHVFVEMFDYACPHCRHTHETIKGAGAKLGGDLAVVALPVPLSSACNSSVQVTGPKFTESCELAKLAVAVWRTDPTKFTEFHNWMFVGADAPTYAAAKQHAATLVDGEKLDTELKSQIPSMYIAKNIELYKRAGSGNVPKLMFSSTSIVGEFTSVDGLVDIIRRDKK